MKSFIKVIKPFCAILFFITLTYFFYYKVFTDRVDGSTLNDGSQIVNGRYYLADIDGNVKEIKKTEWESHVIKGKIFNLSLNYIAIYLIYICYKFLIIPNMKINKDDAYN
ncbi:MAG: hypothetical protein J6T84_12675 [Spirochaetaceae bacterium]|nr:hypothetical protein [Spirochaetaceae bacterium]